MVSTALRELRHHPGRYLAILIAIIISVGFLAASSVVTATESRAMAEQAGAPYTKADLVLTVQSFEDDSYDEDTSFTDHVIAMLTGVTGVADSWALTPTFIIIQNGDASTWATAYAQPPATFSWTTPAAPLRAGEILLDSRTAASLNAHVGTTVTVNQGEKMVLAGITGDPTSVYSEGTGFVASDTMDAWTGALSVPVILVALAPGADASHTTQDIATALSAHDITAKITTGADRVAQSALNVTRGVNVLKYFVWVFAGIALVVGMITIANTFTILLTQRRRQLGLLRAIGASGRQVRRSVWAEAIVLGVMGSLLGVGLAYALAAAIGAFTGSIHFGLVTPWSALIVAFVIGVVITTLASALPARRATRIPILDALRPPEADVVTHKVPPIRTTICGALFVAGVVACVVSLRSSSSAVTLLIAITGAALMSLGVLFGAPLFVPRLLRIVGSWVGRTGVTANVAVKNVTRDPGRSSATATALMLAVGLIVTLQIGASTIQTSVSDKIKSNYPVDLWVASYDSEAIPAATQQRLADATGITASITLNCRAVTIDTPGMGLISTAACAYDPAITQIAKDAPASITDDHVLATPNTFSGFTADTTVTITSLHAGGSDGAASVDVTTTLSNLLRDASFVLVSPNVLAKLASAGSPQVQPVMLFTVSDAIDAVTAVNAIASDDANLSVGGSALQRQSLEQVLTILVDIMTGLLAVAVLIALVGVSSTLTLSVIERTRESALLRALGLKRRQLRLMLLIEALMLTVASSLVGVLFGAFFGLVGAHAVTGQMMADAEVTVPLHFSVNWPQTLLLLGILIMAAALASLLPGRRAALAAPVEALADD
ncbi:MAG: ABC transporter permease [Propionibacteriaceae bacterium]|nr:ABC transporter permease [Propionibacteriaceae bacterium]